jgi:hypothetical protein
MGFLYGCASGFLVYFVSIGQISFNPVQTQAVAAAKSLIRTLAIGSTLLTVLMYWRRKSVFGTTFDGFIIGFTTTIDALSFL